jgi:NDP-sugar pyrophosphorylase family protein
MRAFVLAAGVGSRLRPYTDGCPKPMLQIAGAPILWYHLTALARARIEDVTLNLHYLPDVVRAYVGDGSRWKLRVRYSEEPQLLGTAGALLPVAAQLNGGTFAIVFGDNIIDVDIPDVLDFHRRRGGVATIVLAHRDDVSQSGVAELDERDRITRFIEKPLPAATPSHHVNAGFVLAEPRLLAAIPEHRPSDLGRDVFPSLLERGEMLYGYRSKGRLWWFDRTEDYLSARSDPGLAAFVARFNARGGPASK